MTFGARAVMGRRSKGLEKCVIWLGRAVPATASSKFSLPLIRCNSDYTMTCRDILPHLGSSAIQVGAGAFEALRAEKPALLSSSFPTLQGQVRYWKELCAGSIDLQVHSLSTTQVIQPSNSAKTELEEMISMLKHSVSSRDRIEAAQAVIARAGEVAVDLKPHRIATILTELAVLNEPLSSTPSQPLLQHAATVAVTFEPRAAATTLRALAKLGWVHSGANEGKGVSRGVDAAQTLYENLIENLQVSVLNGAEASAVAWASGKTRVRMTPAMSAELAKRAVETCEEMSAREASSALWGLTVVGIRSHTALFNRMSRDIRMGGFTNVQALSNFLWVCASSSLCPCRHASQSLFAETYLRAGDARASRGPRCGSDPCSAGTIGGDEKTARFGGCLELPMVCKCSEP
jgi:hypothetical protein